MRVMITEEQRRDIETIKPYMIFDKNKKEVVLSDSAPDDVIEAKKRFDEWNREFSK